MIVSLIVAMDEDGGIGKNNALPWHLPSDLKRFKSLTMGHHLIMGRKTWESIGRPLPGRHMLVITRQTTYQASGCTVVGSLLEALELARGHAEQEAFVIGGAQIYAQALETAQRLYLTRVHAHAAADVFFPPIALNQWAELDRVYTPQSEQEPYASTFFLLERRKLSP